MLIFDPAKLKAARKAANLTQSALGSRIHKALSHISNYEKGVAKPTADTLLRIMDALYLRPQDIGTDKDEK